MEQDAKTKEQLGKSNLELDLQEIDNDVDYENLSFWDYQMVRYRKFRAKYAPSIRQTRWGTISPLLP